MSFLCTYIKKKQYYILVLPASPLFSQTVWHRWRKFLTVWGPYGAIFMGYCRSRN
ncbi:hypothetical protein EDB80DRAFT_117827 [Ilyonectria destructans]|nr:hypothetical protein EDB80DRAFT_117827 [Ilyonectria destructans]